MDNAYEYEGELDYDGEATGYGTAISSEIRVTGTFFANCIYGICK